MVRGVSDTTLKIILGVIVAVGLFIFVAKFLPSLFPEIPNPMDPMMFRFIKAIADVPIFGGDIANGIAKIYLTTIGAPDIIIYGKNSKWYEDPKFCQEINQRLKLKAIESLKQSEYLPSSCLDLDNFLQDETHKKKYYEFLINYLAAKNIYLSYEPLGRENKHLAGYDSLRRMICFLYPDFDTSDIYIDERAISAILASFNKNICDDSFITNYIGDPKSNDIAKILIESGAVKNRENNVCFSKEQNSDDDILDFNFENSGKLKLYKDIYAKAAGIDLDLAFLKKSLNLTPRAVCLLIGVDDNGAWKGDQKYNKIVIRSYFVIAPGDWNVNQIKEMLTYEIRNTNKYSLIFNLGCFYIYYFDDLKPACDNLFYGVDNPYEWHDEGKIPDPINRIPEVAEQIYAFMSGLNVPSYLSLKGRLQRYLTEAICGIPSQTPFYCLNHHNPLLSPGKVGHCNENLLYVYITEGSEVTGEPVNYLAVEVMNCPTNSLFSDDFDKKLPNLVKAYWKAIKEKNLTTSVIYVAAKPSEGVAILIHPIAFYASISSIISKDYETTEPSLFKSYGMGVSREQCKHFCEILKYLHDMSETDCENTNNAIMKIQEVPLCNIDASSLTDNNPITGPYISINYYIFIIDKNGNIKENIKIEYPDCWDKEGIGCDHRLTDQIIRGDDRFIW